MNSKIERIANDPEPLAADPYLAVYADELTRRHRLVEDMAARLTGGRMTLADFASGHEYFGLHRTCDGWVFREWAPNATAVTLVGDFSMWLLRVEYRLRPLENGVWEAVLPPDAMRHGQNYQLEMEYPGGHGRRIPAWSRCVRQDEKTKLFTAVVWAPEQPYLFVNPSPPRPAASLIYESHVGMAQEEPKVGSFDEYRERILPRIAASGYNTVQLMAIMEHPYYGSFGYHVANFFAVSSRFGSPDDFKRLVDAAHGLGLRVIIDLVHSHAVRNEAEGLARFDGTRTAYFHAGARGEHTGWDSLCFNYAKVEVLHFLLSNCRFWLDEYQVDGFRFDGVTSMIYFNHGLNTAFTDYRQYFDGNVDVESLTYLALANQVIHEVRPDALTVAEDVSGMPGLASPVSGNGIGFDCRMAMGVTDMWFKLFDLPDESWNMFYLYCELTNRRRDERSIGYVECHDQAIVGGQTAIFRLAGDEIYRAMHRSSGSPVIDRAVALHKMIRLATAACGGDGYLNFMGNEFGHPEWIDFPREGNGWSCGHARRQWSLADDANLRFAFLGYFDREMLRRVVSGPGFYRARVQTIRIDDRRKLIAFERDGFYFFFNFHPSASVTDCEFEVSGGAFETVIDSDSPEFGGFGLRTPGQVYFALDRPDGRFVSLYLPCRTALVLKKKEI
ncbi:MAG: alpha-amylase family glycosyl hydrolase [Victivallaceae bacterium]|nr:alpha-amylase family glycosyl hydrolase [Victivallaceae bacterium]